jgi:hypothetical protein
MEGFAPIQSVSWIVNRVPAIEFDSTSKCRHGPFMNMVATDVAERVGLFATADHAANVLRARKLTDVKDGKRVGILLGS